MYAELLYHKATKAERLFAFVIDLAFIKFVMQIMALLNMKIYGFEIFIIYFTIMHWLSGQTLGKFCLGLKVLNKDADEPNFFQALIRTFLYPIAFLTLYPIHDKIVGTVVVRE